MKNPFENKDIFTFASIVVIIIAGFAVYANSLTGEFVWDDNFLIKDNVFVKSWTYVPKIFSSDLWEGVGRKVNFYRPIQTLSYLVNYSIGELNPIGYHLTNVFLHILVALCVYWFINILYDDNTLSSLTALFFVIHPVLSEVSCYVSTRAESLYSLFLLLAFIFYIKSLHSKKVIPFILMLASYALSLLSKEASLIFPALLALYHYTFREKIRLKEFLSVAGLVCIYILLRMFVTETQVGGSPDSTAFQRFPGFFVAITNYVRLLFLPFNLHMHYGYPLFSFTHPQAVSGLLIMVFLLFCAVKSMKADRLIFFSILWFSIPLLLVSNIYPINAYMAENWLYLPSIGFFLILSRFLTTLIRKGKLKALAAILILFLISFYSYLTISHNDYWSNAINVYEKTLKYAPDSVKLNYNLAAEYRKIDKYKAVELYKKAIDIDPDFVYSYTNLALTYLELGRLDEAINLYKKAIAINPEYASAYYNLAIIYGKTEEAVLLYKKAIEVNPHYAAAYNNLGIIYSETDREEEAIAMLKKAIALNPGLAEPYYNLSVIYKVLGRREEADELFDKALLLSVDNDK